MKKADKVSTALVLNSESVGVTDVLEVLKQELSNLKKIETTPFKTGGNLSECGFSTNLKEEQKVENLIRAFSAICGKEEAYNKAQTRLGVKSAPAFNISGGTTEQYEHDIKLRIQIIQHDARKKELEALVEEAKSFMSKEDNYKMFMLKLKGSVSVTEE